MITRVTVPRRHIHLHQTFTCIIPSKKATVSIYIFYFGEWPVIGYEIMWRALRLKPLAHSGTLDDKRNYHKRKSTDIAVDLMTNQTIKNGFCIKLDIPHGKSMRTFATERNGWWTRNHMFLYFFSCDHMCIQNGCHISKNHQSRAPDNIWSVEVPGLSKHLYILRALSISGLAQLWMEGSMAQLNIFFDI